MSLLVCSHITSIDDSSVPSRKVQNQLDNIKQLIKAGVEIIEIDIQLTKDNIAVLFHDTTLDDRTDGSGAISDKTWDQLKTVRYKEGGFKYGISRLKEAIEYLKSSGSSSIFQLDKIKPAGIKKINDNGLFNGIKNQMLAKDKTFTTPSQISTAGIKFMPIIPDSYVGKMTTQEVIDEIVQKSQGYEFIEAQFSDKDTLLIDGTLAKGLQKIGCKLLVIAVTGGGKTNGVSFRGDSETQWKKMISPMGAGSIMTNKPIALRNLAKTYKPADKSEDPTPPPPVVKQEEEVKQEAVAEAKSQKALEGRLVNSKIKLQKKSGPGEIVGLTELDLSLGQVSFDGIQFTEPGEYVISVIPSSSQLEPTEFTVKVERGGEIVEQAPSGQEEPPVNGSRPIIAQIDEPTVKLEPMTYVATEDQPTSDQTTNLGFLPFVYFGAFEIRPADIKVLNLYYDEFVPKCFMTFTDTYGLVNSPDVTPTSNSVFDLFFNSGSDQLKSIHLQFLVDQKKDNRNGTITIFGKLNLRDFYKIDYKSYTGTSFDVLRSISKELKLGYNSNIVTTNDSMKWIRNGVNLETFIRNIISKSYISDDSFMAGYIDYYYCFNYVDVEKEYNRDNTNDVAIVSTGISQIAGGDDSSKVTKQFLSNDRSTNSTPFYFSKYTFINNATVQLTNEGATTDSKVYDRNNKRFLKFNIDGLVSPDDTLKTLRSEDDINTNYRTEFTGKIDTDNVHENYLYAETQNNRNFTNLANVIADLILPIPNFNIYKFQKIQVVFTNEKTTITEPDKIMTRYTGDWIIIDIGFTFQKSALYQTVRIARKELTKTEKEKENETTTPDNSQNNEVNENPVVEPTVAPVIPNSIYEVGEEVYLEQEGRMYIFVVENVSDNGIEVSGKVKKSTYGLPVGYDKFTPGPTVSQIETQTGQSVSNIQQNDPNIKVQTLLVTFSETTDLMTANGTFFINDTKEVIGIGTASPVPEGKAKQREIAAKAAEVDAINKYKSGQ